MMLPSSIIFSAEEATAKTLCRAGQGGKRAIHMNNTHMKTTMHMTLARCMP
jgi:hypothetical protein